MDKLDKLRIIRLPNDSDYIKKSVPGSRLTLHLVIEENNTKYKNGKYTWWAGKHSYEETTGSVVLTIVTSKYKRNLLVQVRYSEIPCKNKITQVTESSDIEGSRTFYFDGDDPEVDSLYWIDNIMGLMTGASEILTEIQSYQLVFVVLNIDGIPDNEAEALNLKGEVLINGKHLSEYDKAVPDYIVYSYDSFRQTKGDSKNSFYFAIRFTNWILDKLNLDEVTLTFVLLDKYQFTQEAKENVSVKLVRNPKEKFEIVKLLPQAEVAVVGVLDIVENNHKLCKYNSLSAFYRLLSNDGAVKTSEEVILFDETKSVEVATYPLVLGEKETTVFIRQKGLSLDQCRIKSKKERHSRINDHVLYKHDKPILETKYMDALTDTFVDTTKSLVEIPVYYDYWITSKIIIPIQCIWPLGVSQAYHIPLNTCRHSKVVQIDVYPDIEWHVKLSVELEKHGKHSKAGSKNKKFDWNIYFAFGYKYNNSEKREELSILLHSTADKEIKDNNFEVKASSQKVKDALIEYAKTRVLKNILKITNVATFFIKLFDTLKDLTGSVATLIDDNPDSRKKPTVKKIILEARSKKYEWEIKYPNFDIEMSWQATSTLTTPGILLKGKASGMLLGGRFTVDLFAVASSNGYVKAFIFAVDFIANNFLNTKLIFQLVFDAELNFEAEGTYNSSNDETDFAIDLTGDVRVFVELSVASIKKESAKIQTNHNGATNKNTYKEISSQTESSAYTVKGEAGMAAKASIAPEDDGVYIKLNAYNKELFVKVVSTSSSEAKTEGIITQKKKKKKFQRAETPQKKKKEEEFLKSLPDKQTNESVTAKEENEYYKGVLLEEKTWQLFKDGEEYKIKLWDRANDNEIVYADNTTKS